ncbi:unnamed protein product [Didymodactylos carnosus]|uniref:Uncharacterized protein n=1 Tax=Didymodactylos carnosus TaxID=1234261 RepID=A0A815CW51_9BILA|nr:unnamed protein product [Didymodactylos carnosus]CAF4101213.1 unnamed protein product [Didymodactylos carnosus]
MHCKQLIDDVVFMFKYIRNEKLEENYEEILDDLTELCDITDHFIAPLNERFSTHQWLLLSLSRLIPAFIEGKPFDDIKEAVEIYQTLLHGSTSVNKQEFLLYQKK